MPLKVIFFGTSQYSTPIVEALLHNSLFDLVAVITKPKSHYHQLLQHTNTKIFTPTTLKKGEVDQLFNTLYELQPDIGIVSDYGLMIPQRFIDLPKHSILNIHFSKLPAYRGASPVQYTILHGLDTATYTFLEMRAQSEPAMDSGDTVWQKDVPLTGEETTDVLYHRLFRLAADDLETVLTGYTNATLSPIPQDHTQATFTTPSGRFDRTTLIKTDDAFITADMPAEYIERAIRAFCPRPFAWTTLEELATMLEKTDPAMRLRSGKKPNQRVQLLKARLENGILMLEQVQVEGKKPVEWKDFVNGYFE